jgi:hypothetical protein
MYGWMDGPSWFLMSSMMIAWIVLIGVVVYFAARLAHRPHTEKH